MIQSKSVALNKELSQQDQEYVQAHETRKCYNKYSNETQKRLNFSSIYDKFFTVQNKNILESYIILINGQ